MLKVLKITVSIIIFIFVLELIARKTPSYLNEENKNKWQKLFKISQKENISGLQPLISPYLWSNYQPTKGTKHVNLLGFRYGGGVKKTKKRILCMGGSTTWGDGASSAEKTYPAQLEKILIDSGFEVDVVNLGVPYFTTAEMVGTLAFIGIYTNPDIVILHEGLNDCEPFLNNKDYQPDYSHWRAANVKTGIDSRFYVFQVLSQWPLKFPSIIYFLIDPPNPFFRQTLGDQKGDPREALLTEEPIKNPNLGYYNNLKTLAGICMAHNSKPVFMTAQRPKGKLVSLIPEAKTNFKIAEKIENKMNSAFEHHKTLMVQAANDLKVSLIRFDMWNPSNDKMWIDQCHLNDAGEQEKAQFVANELINKKIIGKK
jgi:hypothetical protein